MTYTKRRKLKKQIINEAPEVILYNQPIEQVARMKYLGQIIIANGATSKVKLNQLH